MNEQQILFFVLFHKQSIRESHTMPSFCFNLNHWICLDQCPLLQLLRLDAGLPPIAEDTTEAEQPESEDTVDNVNALNTHTPFTRYTRARHRQKILGKLRQRSEEVF